MEIHHGLWKCSSCGNKLWIRNMNDDNLLKLLDVRFQCGACYGNMFNVWLEENANNLDIIRQ